MPVRRFNVMSIMRSADYDDSAGGIRLPIITSKSARSNELLEELDCRASHPQLVRRLVVIALRVWRHQSGNELARTGTGDANQSRRLFVQWPRVSQLRDTRAI